MATIGCQLVARRINAGWEETVNLVIAEIQHRFFLVNRGSETVTPKLVVDKPLPNDDNPAVKGNDIFLGNQDFHIVLRCPQLPHNLPRIGNESLIVPLQKQMEVEALGGNGHPHEFICLNHGLGEHSAIYDGDLTGQVISDIVLQLLSYVAQTEREMNHQRTLEGITVAKTRGVQFGRKPMQRPCEYDAVYARWKAHEISAREAARLLGVAPSTFLRWVKK